MTKYPSQVENNMQIVHIGFSIALFERYSTTEVKFGYIVDI